MAKAVWDLSSLLQEQTPERLQEQIEQHVKHFCTLRRTLTQKPSVKQLLQLITLKSTISLLFTRVNAYYELLLSENTKDKAILAKLSAFEQWSAELSNRMLFFPLWLMKLPQKHVLQLLKDPKLKPYAYYVKRIRQAKKYTQAEAIEHVLTLKNITSGGAASLYSTFTNGFLFPFEGKQITQEELTSYVTGSNAKKREKAYTALLSVYKEHSTLLTEMYKQIILDGYNEDIKIRGYARPISVRNRSNDIKGSAVQTLLEVVREHASLFHEYFALKHQLNKKSYPFSRFHLYAPYQQKEKTHTYEKSKKYVLETYKRFDEDFAKQAEAIFQAHHVHSHPQPNKRSGAFCYSPHNKEIPFVLLNHTNKLRDVFTLMHELGHGIHGMYARKQVNQVYNSALPMAETASTFGELLLAKRLLNESKDDEEKIAILLRLLDNHYATLIRQTFFVLFEEYAHDAIVEGKTEDELNAHYASLLKEQFGTMEVPELFHYEWHYIPHIHNSPFYCYAYVWGHLLSLSLFELYQEQGSAFVEQYRNLLAAGGSKKPLDLLKDMGIDGSKASFWKKGFVVVKEELELLKSLVK